MLRLGFAVTPAAREERTDVGVSATILANHAHVNEDAERAERDRPSVPQGAQPLFGDGDETTTQALDRVVCRLDAVRSDSLSWVLDATLLSEVGVDRLIGDEILPESLGIDPVAFEGGFSLRADTGAHVLDGK
jgi:hypothetical protein